VAQYRERRASPRCIAVKNKARLELTTPSGARNFEARLVNISRAGALVIGESLPPLAGSVRLRLESPAKTDWATAVTVRSGRIGEVALGFPRGCPDDLLMAGTIGINILLSFFTTTESGSFGDVEI
jgi:hypothetical protein